MCSGIVWCMISYIIDWTVIEDNGIYGVCFIDRESCAVKHIDVDINTSISSIFIQII